MSGQNVGGVRPTQLIYTYGVGPAVDLPQFSAMVMGLDDWPAANMEEIREDRLLRVVRHVLGAQVRKLKAAPLREDVPGPLIPQFVRGRRARGRVPALVGVYAVPAVGAHTVRAVRVSRRHEPARTLRVHAQELPAPRQSGGHPGTLPGGVRERPHRRFPLERIPARRRERRSVGRHADMFRVPEEQANGSGVF